MNEPATLAPQTSDKALLAKALLNSAKAFGISQAEAAAIGRAVSQRCWINTATSLQSNAAKGRNRAGLFGGDIGPTDQMRIGQAFGQLAHPPLETAEADATEFQAKTAQQAPEAVLNVEHLDLQLLPSR